MIVGTGGIGCGISMRMVGDHSLGREESRAVTLLDVREYCKLHIVFHYLQVLVGGEIPIVPIGKVGDDEAGSRLLLEMESVGLVVEHIGVVDEMSTLFSVAFSYPNGEGGNLTTQDSASAHVGPADVRRVEPALTTDRAGGIAVALPEVPLSARHELLRMGGELGFLRVATFISGEAQAARQSGILADVDLLVLNRDEAAAFTNLDVGDHPATFAESAIHALLDTNSSLSIVITAGMHGSWSWDGATVAASPAVPSPVRSTAGAGDAHLAGIITGLVDGLDLHAANRLGALISSLKVTSRHTINPEISWQAVGALAGERGIRLPDALLPRVGRES